MSLRTYHTKYKSPMAAVCEIAENSNRAKKTFSMADYRHNKKLLAKIERRKNAIAKIFDRSTPKNTGQKWTIVKRLPKNTGFNFHATGVGDLKVADFSELKAKLKELGYTNFRSGAIKGSL